MNDPKFMLDDCRDILSQLVRVNSCQPEGNEKDVVNLLTKILSPKLTLKVIDHGNNRASLVAELEGLDKTPGIALLGHIDTVACKDLKNWDNDPHEAKVIDNILYGRGSADMKGGVAAMVLAANHLVSIPQKPRRSLLFCFTADEEAGGLGACSLVEGKYLNDVESIIICEASDDKVSFCEKGALWLRLDIHGVASHASRPDLGRNAVEYAIWFIQRLKEHMQDGNMHRIMGQTTVSVTNFHGGVMTNIIPSEAFVELDIRTIPGVSHDDIVHTAEQLCNEMQSKYSHVHAEIQVLNDRPALECDPRSQFHQDVVSMAKSCEIGTEGKGHFFYTDASQVIPHLNIPFVIAGPGDDAMAHKANECIDLHSVSKFASFYTRFLTKHYW